MLSKGRSRGGSEMAANVAQRLRDTPAQHNHITPTTFRDDGKTPVNATGERSKIAELTLDTPLRLKSGRRSPFRVAIPAYEKLGPTDGTTDNSETFNLSHSIVDSPVTQDAVVYLDGNLYGAPDSIDYANDSIDVTDPNTASDVYVFYISDAAATLSLYKAIPNSETSNSQRLWKNQLARLHEQEQSKQPEFFTFSDRSWKPYLASDMKLRVYIDAPYEVRFEDPDGHGNTATNILLNIPTEQAQRTVPGLISTIKASMGQ